MKNFVVWWLKARTSFWSCAFQWISLWRQPSYSCSRACWASRRCRLVSKSSTYSCKSICLSGTRGWTSSPSWLSSQSSARRRLFFSSWAWEGSRGLPRWSGGRSVRTELDHAAARLSQPKFPTFVEERIFFYADYSFEFSDEIKKLGIRTFQTVRRKYL